MGKGMLLRTKEGLLIGKFPMKQAGIIMEQCEGNWRPWRGKDGGTVFEITEDCQVSNSYVSLYLWKGFTFHPEK